MVLAVVLTLVSSLVGPAGAQVATPAVGASSSSFVGLPPLRLLDTRSGVGAPVGKLISGESLDVQVAGRGGVPRDAVAVALNVTVTDPTGPGWLTAHAAGTAVPGTSNLNFVVGQTVPNLVVASVGLGGAVSISAAAGSGVEPPRVHVVADVFGYFVNDTGFSSVDPTRLLDTRSRPGGAPVPRDGVVTVPVAGLAGVPADAGSVAVTFTVTSPTGGGWLTGYPSGAAPPATSNLNFVAGQTVPNLAVVKVGAGGAINVKVGAPAGAPMSVHVVIDVLGWFPAGGDFTGLAPQRLLDTRSGIGAPSGPVGSGGQVELVVGGRGGVPVDAGTVVLNLTVTSPTGAGWLTGFPTGGQPPPTSNVNFSPGQTVANLVAVKVGAGGEVTLRVQPAGAPGLSTHIVADVFGYFDAGLDDPIAPTVAITSPAPGASVVAAPLEIEVSGTAGDAVGVASVQLEVAGQEIIAADVDTSVAPATWKADLSPPAGTHTVTAVARDLAGNATSTTRTFTVSYPTAPLGVVQDPDVVTPADGTIAGVTADELRLDDSVTVEVGDTIAVGPTTNAPDGLLRTVVSREVIGGETVVATEPATVTDVIQRGFVEFGGPVEAEPGASAPASGLREWAGDGASSPLVEGDVGSSLTLGGKLEAKKNVGSSCPPEPITPPPTGLCTRVKVSAVASMSVGLELQGALDVGFKTCICWDAGPYIQRFKLALEGSLSSVAALKAEASFEIAVWENQKPDLSATLAQTPIWGPLYLSSQFEARIKASINLKAALEASYETIDTVTVGAEYTESGGWRDLYDHDRTGTGTLPEVSGELSATGRLGIELNFEFLINGVAGPTMTITPYVQLTLSASTTSAKPGFVTGRVLLEAGITVGFGAEVEIPVINKTLAKYGPKTVLEARVVLVNESREIYLGGGASALTVNGAAGAGTASKDAATGAVTGTVLEAEVVRGQAHEVVLRRTTGGLPVCGSIRTRAGEELAGINLRSGDPTRVTFTRPVSADNPGGSETTRVLFVMEPCSGANPGTATVEVWLSTPVDISGAVTGSAQPVPALRPGQTGRRTVVLPAGATGTLTASGQCPTFSAVIVLRNADGTSVDGPFPNGCIPGGAINKTWDITGGTRTFEIMSPNGLPAGAISTTFNLLESPPPPPPPPLGAAQAVTAGRAHTCALTVAGGVKCWGSGAGGQLGDGRQLIRVPPVDVIGLGSGVKAISAGVIHTCALTVAGGVNCWGSNGFGGQLGDGTTTNRLTPVNVTGLGSGVTVIAAGDFHTCAVTVAGGVKCWGSNFRGALGDGTSTDRLTPVDVTGLGSGVTAIAAGGFHTCALTVGGGVKCWGNNFRGALGDGTNFINRLMPVDVTGLGSGVKAIAAGRGDHTCAVTVAGGVKCWGPNSWGVLGDGTTTDRLTPVNVTGLGSGVTVTTAGDTHTCAVTVAGGVKCWGRNFLGELGDGTITDRLTPVNVTGFG